MAMRTLDASWAWLREYSVSWLRGSLDGTPVHQFTGGSLTLSDADYCTAEDEIPTGPRQCVWEAVEVALVTSTLMPEQCMWLHDQGIAWEIHLRERVVRLRKGEHRWELPMFSEANRRMECR